MSSPTIGARPLARSYAELGQKQSSIRIQILGLNGVVSSLVMINVVIARRMRDV